MSNPEFSNPIVKWIDYRLPIFSMMHHELHEYPTPKNLNYFWNFGSLAGIVLGIMIVSGIVLAPSDPEALAPVVKRAYESGIPVVIIDSALTDGAKGTYQAFLSTDNCAAGEEVAKRMIDEAGTEGKVAVMSYVAGVGSEIGRVGCFSDYLTANSDLEIVGPYYSQSQMAQALNQTTDILASNPDLVGIFGANEPTAVNATVMTESGPVWPFAKFLNTCGRRPEFP